MDADAKKKQVNLDQLTALLDFLKEHQDLAKGLTRGRRGKFLTLKVWNLCAKKMNAIEDGAIKDGKGWSKYWCDWKYRVRRRALELKAAKDNNRPPPDGVVPLSPMEETIMNIIGENSVDNIVIKHDPLGDDESDGDELDNNDNHNDEDQFERDPGPSREKKPHSRDRLRAFDDLDRPNSPPIAKRRKFGRNGYNDSDQDDEATEFLRLEREKLANNKLMVDSLQKIRTEISRVADFMENIKDILAKRHRNNL